MSITNIQVGAAGFVGVKPQQIFINSTDDLGAITAAGYLSQETLVSPVYAGDFVFANGSSGLSLIGNITISSGVITIASLVNNS